MIDRSEVAVGRVRGNDRVVLYHSLRTSITAVETGLTENYSYERRSTCP
jgi:hypothetical protein